MSPLFLLMPIILPILGGFGIFFLGFEEEKKGIFTRRRSWF